MSITVMTPKKTQFAETLLLSVEGTAITLMVLAVLAVSGLPPYARIITDLRAVLSLLVS